VQVDPSSMMHYQRQIAFNNKSFKRSVETAMGLPYPIGKHEILLDIEKIHALNYVKNKGKKERIIEAKGSIEERLENTKLILKCNKFIEDFITTKGIHNHLNPSLKFSLTKSLALGLRVYLVQMPELMLRMMTATEFTLGQLQGMLEVILKQGNKSISVGELIARRYPETYYVLRSLYMNALIRNLALVHRNSLLIVMEHPYVDSLVKEVNATQPEKLPNYNELLTLPIKEETESNEELIEKHALLDAVYGTKIWKELYIDNPYIYLDYNKAAIPEKDAEEYKKTYAKRYKAYKELIEKSFNK